MDVKHQHSSTSQMAIKQGCVIAPLLFCIFFSIMLLVAFKDCDKGIPVRDRTEGSVFNLRRLHASSRTLAAVIHDLQFADDCALLAHTEADAQHLFSLFLNTASRFGLTVSLKKTEVMLQSYSGSSRVRPTGDCLPVVDKFATSEIYCHLTQISTMRLPPASPKPAIRSAN